MTVYLGRNIQKDQIHDYRREGGETRNFVYLSKDKSDQKPLGKAKIRAYRHHIPISSTGRVDVLV